VHRHNCVCSYLRCQLGQGNVFCRGPTLHCPTLRVYTSGIKSSKLIESVVLLTAFQNRNFFNHFSFNCQWHLRGHARCELSNDWLKGIFNKNSMVAWKKISVSQNGPKPPIFNVTAPVSRWPRWLAPPSVAHFVGLFNTYNSYINNTCVILIYSTIPVTIYYRCQLSRSITLIDKTIWHTFSTALPNIHSVTLFFTKNKQ
jgi:hypothetical protein